MRARAWLAAAAIGLLAAGARVASGQSDRIQLTFDPSEADAAIAILRKQHSHQVVAERDWQALFATVPYQWLKAREASMHRDFTDSGFRAFLEAPSTLARLPEFEQALTGWERADMAAIGARALVYLPQDAMIRARVFPEIKPKTNSFVWRKDSAGPAIFLYLERGSQAQFENTVAHESHHIGFASIQARQDSLSAGVSPTVKTTLDRMGAFGEGHAMLAAAGGPAKHPHWEDDSVARARWDADMEHFSGDLLELQEFFTDVLDGKIVGDSAVQARASKYYGYQGPWYTVGYRMDVMVEQQFGRPALIRGMVDPRVLLVLYNRAAQAQNARGGEHLSTWSPAFLARIGATDALANQALTPAAGSG